MLFTKRAAAIFAPTDAHGNVRTIDPGEVQLWGMEVEEGVTVTPEQFGASTLASGATNAAALKAALDSGNLVDGRGRHYNVEGFVTPTHCRLRNITLIQTVTAPSGNSRTLDLASLFGVELDNVHLQKADVTVTTLPGNGAFHLEGCHGAVLTRCSVTGGANNAFRFTDCDDLLADGCRATDMSYVAASAAGGAEFVQGFFLTECDRAQLVGCRCRDASGTVGGSPSTLHSRAFVFGSPQTWTTVTGCHAIRFNQGFDFTGSFTNEFFTVSNCIATQCYQIGFKASNLSRFGVFSACIADKVGLYGFIAAGSGVQDVIFDGCLAFNVGFEYAGVGQPFPFIAETTTVNGFPQGVKFVGCRAVDTTGSPPPCAFFGENINAGGAWRGNEIIGCSAVGFALLERGFEPAESRFTATGVTIPNAAWTTPTYTEQVDTFFAFASNVFTAPVTGWFKASGSVTWASNDTGMRGLRWLKNGSLDESEGAVVLADVDSASSHQQSVSTMFYLDQGQTLALQVFQSSSGDLTATIAARIQRVPI